MCGRCGRACSFILCFYVLLALLMLMMHALCSEPIQNFPPAYYDPSVAATSGTVD